jgi:NADH:ubiquinone oxidoreductase subunit 5 (subunit L)/multisubunit Na+/H+ antiporter MnhA subunit
MIVNRIGDAALALGMFIIYYSYSSLDFNVIFALVPYLLNDTLNILGFELYTVNCIGILLLLAAAGKSAQLGLHT